MGFSRGQRPAQRELLGSTATARQDAEGSPALWWSVARWVAGALVLYGISFWVLGWVFSGHPGWPGVHTKPEMYDLARSSAAMAGILGGAAAVAVALRRQKSTEESVRIAVKTQQTAADAYDLDLQRTENDRVTALRARYTEAARQLGDSSAAVRLAGAYAMAALADDWIRRWNTWAETRPDLTLDQQPETNHHQEAQACIDVLCAYIRTPRRHEGNAGDDTEERADREVRQTIIRITCDHLLTNAQVRWAGFDLDYTGAVFDGTFSFERAMFGEGAVSFDHATFSGGAVSFDHATFSGGAVSFLGAKFSGAEVSFDEATFSGRRVSFDEATFSGGRVSFDWATFSEEDRVSFNEATFSGGRVSFFGSTFSGGGVSFLGSTFSGGDVSFIELQRSWVANSKAMFSGDTVYFGKATFSGGTVNFHATGGTVSFRGTGVTVSFGEDLLEIGEAARWESKKVFPTGPWGDRTPPWGPGEQWSWPLQPILEDESS